MIRFSNCRIIGFYIQLSNQETQQATFGVTIGDTGNGTNGVYIAIFDLLKHFTNERSQQATRIQLYFGRTIVCSTRNQLST